MNDHALRVLQFRETLDVVAGFAAGPLGAQAVRALHPSDTLAWVDEELRRVDEMMVFLQRTESWAAPAIPDLTSQLRKLQVEGSVLDPPVFREALHLLSSSRSSRSAILKQREQYERIAVIGERLVDLEKQEGVIDHAIGEDGNVRDAASRELGRLRREIRSSRSRIVEKLESYIASLPAKFRVEDASVSVRDGRYVIPVRRDGRGEVGGIVHD